ncbi:Uncharacterised protein [uncultured archaeon]|nr:Uncharacterised protein [uncultured archaeon]
MVATTELVDLSTFATVLSPVLANQTALLSDATPYERQLPMGIIDSTESVDLLILYSEAVVSVLTQTESASTATPSGFEPTPMVATTELSALSILDTVLLPALQTHS